MSLKSLFRLLLAIQITLGAGLAILSVALFRNQKELSRSQRVHHQSYLLADELRQSSDDLTRLARTYVATGDAEFEREYWTVLAIRNGTHPRPESYNRIYWDFAPIVGESARTDGEAVPLRTLMVREGFTDAEFAKLALAQRASDRLVRTELIAMNAVKGLFDDGAGHFTVRKAPDRALAMRIMNDRAYHEAKVAIMRPIDDFYVMFEQRTAASVARYERRSWLLLEALGALIAVMMGVFGVSFVTVQRQIAERERAEEALRASETRYRTLFEQAGDYILVLEIVADGPPVIHDVNEAAQRFLGYTPEELIGRPVSVLEPDVSAEVNRDRLQMIAERGTAMFEARHRRKDGSWFDAEVRTTEIVIEGKRMAIVTEHDITDRKRAEEALREREERFRSVYEDATLGLYRTTPDGRILLANPALVRMLGYDSFEDLAARDLSRSDAYEPSYARTEFVRRIETAGEVRGLESEWRRKDGTTLTVRENARAVRDASGRLLYFDGVVEDVSEKRRMEEALSKSLALIEATLESTANGVLVVGLDGVVLKANGKFAEMWQIPDDVLASGDDGRLISHVLEQLSDPDAFLAGVKALYGDPRAESADLLGFKDGRVFERTSKPMLVGVEPKGRVWSFLDITERKRSEESLREAEQRYRSLFDQANEGLILMTMDGRLSEVNQAFAEMHGYTVDELKGIDIRKLDVLHEKTLEDRAEILRRIDAGEVVRFDVEHYHKDGHLFPLAVSASTVAVGGRRFYLSSHRDITESRRAELENQSLQAQLHQAQKAESLGRMAGAVAHHYNNLLGAALLNLELAETKLPADSAARNNVAEAMKSSQRAAEISGQMLAYLGQERGRRAPMDLCETCREVLPLLSSSLPGHTRLESAFPADRAIVQGDAMQLTRVLSNLVVNASEAILDGEGRVSVTVGLISAADIHVRRFYPVDWVPKAATYACLSVADTGHGMAPDQLDKLFDPFFSTKFTGRGLGLPVVLGIVGAHEGACAVESRLGQGTTVRVFLPVIA